MDRIPDLEQDRLFYPTVVHTDVGDSVSIKQASVGFELDEYEKEKLAKVNWLALQYKVSMDDKMRKKRRSSKRKESVSSDIGDLTTETQVSFVVPPGISYPFHIRYRENVGNLKGEWRNPLIYKDGAFFSPKLKIKDEFTKIPPPILLSRAWERNNVQPLSNLLNKRDKNKIVQRVYTISGLTPSVEKGSSWAGWLLGTASKGMYGKRTVDIQFASEENETVDMNGVITRSIRNFRDIPEADWQLVSPVSYAVPSVDILSSSLSLVLNWIKSTGIKQLEDLMMGELIQNKSRNSNVIQQFVKEVLVKLKPIWEKQVVPYLDNDPSLQFILKQNRDIKAREISLGVMEVLKEFNLIQEIPLQFKSIRPNIIGIDIKTEVNDGIKRLSEKNGRICYKVIPGSPIRISVLAGESKSSRQRTRLQYEGTTNPVVKTANKIKIWYTLYNVTNKRYLDLRDDDLIEGTGGLIQGPGRKIRLKKAFSLRSELRLRGKDEFGNCIVEDGDILEIRICVEEYGAHEDYFQIVSLEYRSDEMKPLYVENEQRPSRIQEESPETEQPVRRSHVSIASIPKSASEVEEILSDLRKKEEFRNASLLDRKFLEITMLRLGKVTSSFDISEILEVIAFKLEEADTRDIDHAFINFYVESKYNTSILSNVLEQVNKSLVNRKNTFLRYVLEVPEKKMKAIESSNSLFSLPEKEIISLQSKNFVKSLMIDTYRKYKKKPLSMKQPGGSGGLEDVSTEMVSGNGGSKSSLNLENIEELDDVGIAEVGEAFVRNLLITFIGRHLPESSFQNQNYMSMFRDKSFSLISRPSETIIALRENTDQRNSTMRKEWIETQVDNASLGSTIRESFIWSCVGFYREYKLMKDEARLESEKNKEVRAREKEYMKNRLSALLDNSTVETEEDLLEEFEIKDVCSHIIKEIVKSEIDGLIRDIVPEVSKTISEKIIPAIVSGIFSGATSLVWHNKLKIVFVGFGFFSTLFYVNNPKAWAYTLQGLTNIRLVNPFLMAQPV